MIAAKVVLFPLPVVPVTSTSPRGSSAISWITGGRKSSSKGLIFRGDDSGPQDKAVLARRRY